MNIIILGIAGGTGSGKTYTVKNLLKEYPSGNIVSISIDSYYKDLSHINYKKRIKQNFDHPDSIDINLLEHHLERASKGREISIPIYDFNNHIRIGKTSSISNMKIIIVEGIFAKEFSINLDSNNFYFLELRINKKDCMRRVVHRDLKERGKVIKQAENDFLISWDNYYENNKNIKNKSKKIIIREMTNIDKILNKIFN